jgi:hypothetical protein
MRFTPAKGGLALPLGAGDTLNMETTITLISLDKDKPENATSEIQNWLGSAIVTADELAQMTFMISFPTLCAAATGKPHLKKSSPGQPL